ncbi:hypothetical protein HRbin37_01312 [bacterium HR37]|jgi:hypothetical protein|nr:hypothetical protein HRbin37_01312 [bacterium HR37]
MTIGFFESALESNLPAEREEEVEGVLREKGKHTMMAVKRLGELGIETPKREGDIAERFGESIGRVFSVFGWRGAYFLVWLGNGIEGLILKIASRVCGNSGDRKILEAMMLDKKTQ